MEQLSGLDATFLAMESGTVRGHGGGVCVLGSGAAPLTLDALTALLAERMPALPALRRRLATVPLGLDQPWWREVEPELACHVHEIELAPGADDRALAREVARLHARPLDRSRPLWEVHLLHG
ncbi:MAG: wax ester/triacylglycerol synthase family O-acyltransferase, partial [Actinomycetota bacterium]|nr:wax ester/triacylglycerol synthase family O-acyltransferase [Actinomycetota bacterium]